MNTIKERILNLDFTFGVYTDEETGERRVVAPLLALNIMYLKYMQYSGKLDSLIHAMVLGVTLDNIEPVIQENMKLAFNKILDNGEGDCPLSYAAVCDMVDYIKTKTMQSEMKTILDFMNEDYTPAHGLYFIHILGNYDDESLAAIRLNLVEFVFGKHVSTTSSVITESTNVKFKDILPFLHNSFYMQLFTGLHAFLNKCHFVNTGEKLQSASTIVNMEGEFLIEDPNNTPHHVVESMDKHMYFRPRRTKLGYGNVVFDGHAYSYLLGEERHLKQELTKKLGRTPRFRDHDEYHRNLIKEILTLRKVMDETDTTEFSTRLFTSMGTNFWDNAIENSEPFIKYPVPNINPEARGENITSDPNGRLWYSLLIGGFLLDEDNDDMCHFAKARGDDALKHYYENLNNVFKNVNLDNSEEVKSAQNQPGVNFGERAWAYFLATYAEVTTEYFEAVECIQINLAFEFQHVTITMRNVLGEPIGLHVVFKNTPKVRAFH